MKASLWSEFSTAGGLLSRKSRPDLASQLDWALRNQELTTLLPGVYALPEVASSLPVRLRAVGLWDPDAIVTGSAAAAACFWPELRVDDIDLALAGSRAIGRPYRVERRRIPPEWVTTVGGVRMTTPALTAIDLCPQLEGDAIDRVLRLRAASLADLWAALHSAPGRRDNSLRRTLLLDSRDEPWSKAERVMHRLLREHGITEWIANYAVSVGGRRFYLDIAFPDLKVAIEVDGKIHATDLQVFESDRQRQNLLLIDGWQVLRFTWRRLIDEPQAVVDEVRAVLGARTP